MYSTGLFDRAWSHYRKPVEEQTIARAHRIESTRVSHSPTRFQLTKIRLTTQNERLNQIDDL
jgi:hypothetical protein